MTESTNQVAEKTWAEAAAKIGWTILIVATLYVCYFSHLGAIGFVGPDEPRYAWVARDMVETGDWVTPHLYGKPWFEKPPLFYWGAALCFKLFGVSEAAARLPSAISALLATLVMAWLALRFYGVETARWLLLLLPTTVGMIGFSHAAATDMPFSGMLTIAMVAAAVVIGLARNENTPTIPRTPWLAFVLFGFFLGLAVLAKGPAAIVLCGGAVFFWALFTKRWRDALRLLHPVAIATFCLTALPWYILCARRNPDFLRVFLIEHNFKRFLTPEFQHVQPFWFYLPVLLVAFLPWTALFLWSSVQGALHLWRTRCTKESTWFLICWAGFCVVFFCISQSKLPGYILPAVPAIVMLIAHDLNRRLREKLSHVRWLCMGVSLTLVLVGVAAGLLCERIPLVSDIRPSSAVIQFYALMTLAGIAVGILTVLRQMSAALALAAIALPAFLTLGTVDFSELDAGVSARPAAMRANRCFPQELIESASTYKLSRGARFALNFYFHRELREWSPPGGRRTIIFTPHKGSQELKQMGVVCVHYPVNPAVEICVDSIRATSLGKNCPDKGEPQ